MLSCVSVKREQLHTILYKPFFICLGFGLDLGIGSVCVNATYMGPEWVLSSATPLLAILGFHLFLLFLPFHHLLAINNNMASYPAFRDMTVKKLGAAEVLVIEHVFS